MATRDPQTQDERIKQQEDDLKAAIRLGENEETIEQLRDGLLYLREQKEKQREEDQEP